jgi:hypothetical protein
VRIARAEWRPLPQNATAAVIKPRLIIVHTQVGRLRGTESWFKNPAAGGVESTFGIGGPWDGPALDGKIWQWMDTHRQADCNLSANGISVSVEVSDGGDPSRPFSAKQLASLIVLTADLCAVEHIPPTLARAWNGSGLGWHQLFKPQWDVTHDCPGSVRRNQLLNVVFPAVAARLNPPKGSPVAGLSLSSIRQWNTAYNFVVSFGRGKNPWQQGVEAQIAELRAELAALTPPPPVVPPTP